MITELTPNCFSHFACMIIIISLCSMAWINVILDSPVGDWFHAWGQKHFATNSDMEYKSAFHKSVWYVVFHCVYCNTGQIALWTYLIVSFRSYNPLIHMLFTLSAIGTTYILHRLTSN